MIKLPQATLRSHPQHFSPIFKSSCQSFFIFLKKYSFFVIITDYKNYSLIYCDLYVPSLNFYYIRCLIKKCLINTYLALFTVYLIYCSFIPLTLNSRAMELCLATVYTYTNYNDNNSYIYFEIFKNNNFFVNACLKTILLSNMPCFHESLGNLKSLINFIIF